MGLRDVAFLPSCARFSTTSLEIVVEVKASGTPHVLRLCLDRQGHAPCKILLLRETSFYVS